MHKLHRFFLFLASFVLTVQAQARPALCQSFFSEEKWIVDDYNSSVLDNLRSHFELSENQNLLIKSLVNMAARPFILRKLSNAPENANLHNILRAQKFLRIAQRIQNREPLFENKESPESLWLQRELLGRSIDSLIINHTSLYPAQKAKALQLLRKIFGNRAVQFLLNPARLPMVKDKKIPEELLEKIFRDGLEKNEKELSMYFSTSGQKNIEGYRRFANIYFVVFSAVMIQVLLDQTEDFKKEVNEKKIEKLDESLESMDAMLDLLDKEFESRGLYE
jgi:hypothetical protein